MKRFRNLKIMQVIGKGQIYVSRYYDAFCHHHCLSNFLVTGIKQLKRIYGRPTHNDLLEILYDYGVMSLVIYLLFLYNCLVRRYTIIGITEERLSGMFY